MRARVRIMAAVGCLVIGQAAIAGPMQITEWMYKGTDGEFVEFTNTGLSPVDLTDWSYSDSDNQPGDLGFEDVFGVVQPGESVILTETDAEVFRQAWGLATNVKIFGGNENSNLGRNDAISLYDADGLLMDTLVYGDQDYPGSIRTENKSCNIAAADYGFTTVRTIAEGWAGAYVGDVYGSWASTNGDVGTPGTVVPEPTTVALLSAGLALAGLRRRRNG
ncbi:MAG: lamin tail domain-containing protein [Phycisphaerae bacterium]|nr:lamin tail domain-containing protein [Phycisphaerae bacterium]